VLTFGEAQPALALVVQMLTKIKYGIESFCWWNSVTLFVFQNTYVNEQQGN
jgi:hypothetical protein